VNVDMILEIVMTGIAVVEEEAVEVAAEDEVEEEEVVVGAHPINYQDLSHHLEK